MRSRADKGARVRALAVLLALAPWPVEAVESGERPPVPLTLEWCLERAERANPLVAIDEASTSAARNRIAYAGALDDPRLSYEASNVPRDELDFDSTSLSGHQFGLLQKLPFPGLLASREDAARAAAQAAELELSDRKIRVGAAVERAWAELGFAQRAREITDRNLDLLRQLAQIAATRYRVGSGLQQDVLRAQVELTALLQERLQRQAAVQVSGAALVALLDLPAASRLPATSELDDPAPLPGLDSVRARARQGSPTLRALHARVEEAQRARDSARLEGYPDFDLKLGYRIRKRVAGDPVAGDDFLAAGVTVRLPVNRGKWRARVAEQGALLRRAEARYRDARARLNKDMGTAFAELERADAEIRLLDTGLLPQARQSLESSRSAYQVGRVDFSSLLDTQVRLLRAELRRVRAQADRRVAFSALEASSGGELR